MDDNHIQSGIDGKVLYCSGCMTAVFDEPIIEQEDEKGKVKFYCPYCTDKLVNRREDRVGSYLTGKVIAPALSAPRDSVTRLFTSPWGKVKMHISVHSHFAPSVELNGVPNPAIKRLIDESFSDEAVISSFSKLPGEDAWVYAGFIIQLQDIIRVVQRDPNAVEELDLDLVTA